MSDNRYSPMRWPFVENLLKCSFSFVMLISVLSRPYHNPFLSAFFVLYTLIMVFFSKSKLEKAGFIFMGSAIASWIGPWRFLEYLHLDVIFAVIGLVFFAAVFIMGLDRVQQAIERRNKILPFPKKTSR